MAKTTKAKRGAPKGAVRNPTGRNQFEGVRSERPIAVRLLTEIDEAVRSDAKRQGVNLTAWVEDAAKLKLSGAVSEEKSELVIEAIALSIEVKEAAVRREKKSKCPDQAQIEKWEAQIEELERLLPLLHQS